VFDSFPFYPQLLLMPSGFPEASDIHELQLLICTGVISHVIGLQAPLSKKKTKTIEPA
jgi:hypothetical protein